MLFSDWSNVYEKVYSDWTGDVSSGLSELYIRTGMGTERESAS